MLLKALCLLGIGLAGYYVWPHELAAIGFVVAGAAFTWMWAYKPHELQRKRLRRSAQFNEKSTILLSEDGLRWSMPGSVTQQDWILLDRVVRRPEGFLVHLRGGSVAWLPDAGLVDGTPTEVEDLLRDKVGPLADR
jgi:hypothetical protein